MAGDVRRTQCFVGRPKPHSLVDAETDQERTREFAHPVASINGELPCTMERRKRSGRGRGERERETWCGEELLEGRASYWRPDLEEALGGGGRMSRLTTR